MVLLRIITILTLEKSTVDILLDSRNVTTASKPSNIHML